MPTSKNIKPAKAGKTNSKRPKVKAKQHLFVVAKTNNGRLIQKLLAKAGRDLRSYKDWCVMTTGRLIDWVDSYNVVGKDGPLVVEGATLVHKSELHKLLPKQLADAMWNKDIGRRVTQKGPPS